MGSTKPSYALDSLASPRAAMSGKNSKQISAQVGNNDMQKKLAGAFGAALVAVLSVLGAPAQAQTQQPNILVIWGDDIGGFNISAYNRGMMG